MLTLLRVRNLAVIDELEVEFGPGLNVLTGETGAGKSVLVAALGLVLGARASADVVRTGAERAEVEALFELGDESERLRDVGLDPAGELVIRRVVEPQGRTRAYANGRLVPVGQLAALASGLVDICSQHEHHTLVDPATHLGYLDAFAGLDAARRGVGEAVAALAAARAEADAAKGAVREAADREEFLRFQLAEIDRVDPRAGEEDALAAEAQRLRHADQLAALLARAEAALYAEDGAVVARLARVLADLAQAARIDPALAAPLAEPVEAARVELEEAARAVGRAARGVRADPERLAEVEERVHLLRRLVRKHGSVEGALAHREAARRELAALRELDVEALEARLADAEGRAAGLAGELSERRRAAAGRLGDAITAELASLGMGAARVEVDVGTVAQLGPTGLDRVEFLIATNPGEEPRPLRRVASGGELSRALLALKRVLAGLGPVGTYVFDEVDSGVGGAVAETIGRKLAEVGRFHQVLCITHLPQVAACGTTHLHARKEVARGRTRTLVARLSPEDRVEELARMLGGAEVGEEARGMARALLRANAG